MSFFLKNFTVFFLLTIGGTVIGLGVIKYRVSTGPYYSVADSTTLLIFGDSHPETSFNDSIIHHSQNFAASGESYFYTYLKVKTLLEHNPQVKTVFIEFNNGQIVDTMDELIWGDTYLPSAMIKYSSSMRLPEYSVLLRHNPGTTLRNEAPALKVNLNRLRTDRPAIWYGHWGMFNALTNDGTDLIQSMMERGDTIMRSDFVPTSETNLRYLRNAVELCRSRGVQIFLVAAPVHRAWGNLPNEKTFRRVLEQEFKGELFLDFRKFRAENSEFADVHHLNFKGARKFSGLVEELIRNGLLDSPEPQKMIDAAIAEK